MQIKTIGSTLRKLRERSGLSVKEVVKALKEHGQDISDKTLYSYESDKRASSADMLISLCQIYKCNNILETFSDVEVDYSIPDDFEFKLLEKYRTLDNHGKEMVNMVLNKELSRFNEPKKETSNTITHLTPIAAHNDDTSEEQVRLMREDLDEL